MNDSENSETTQSILQFNNSINSQSILGYIHILCVCIQLHGIRYKMDDSVS